MGKRRLWNFEKLCYHYVSLGLNDAACLWFRGGFWEQFNRKVISSGTSVVYLFPPKAEAVFLRFGCKLSWQPVKLLVRVNTRSSYVL